MSTDSPDAHGRLAGLGERYFTAQHTNDPLNATLLGVAGFDAMLPDISRAGSRRAAAEFAAVLAQLNELDDVSADERTERDVLRWLVDGARSDAEHSLWEANASAAGYVSPQALIFQAVPKAAIADDHAVGDWLTRLDLLAGYVDTLRERYVVAAEEGRVPTRVGVDQALVQLRGHLARPIADDALVAVALPAGRDDARHRASDTVSRQVRPALRRLAADLEQRLRPTARDDEHVGIGSVPGGDAGYLAAVKRHTTTDLTPRQIHEIGLARLDELDDDWSRIGSRALGTRDGDEIHRRLREDPALRFETTDQLVASARDALARAEAARADWFPDFPIGRCVIETIDPVEAENAALGHYRPPSEDGSRPGAFCVLATDPRERFAYEYEALTFHESVPGHHLSIASAQTLDRLPPHRRYVDAQLCAYVEGWGLYSEGLADEMGLYSSDLARLGMLSFEALRACRLVVDTGMHAFGWSRSRAARFMWEHTATTRANVSNEIDRYIAWPGQALSYQIGKREFRRLRRQAERDLGDRFDPRGFHGAVLGEGAVPLPVLGDLVAAWVEAAR